MTNSNPSKPPSKPVVETSPDLGIITPVYHKIVFNSRLRGCNEKVLCIDPGTEKSGVVIIDYKREENGDRMAVIPLGSEVDNDEVLYILHDNTYGCNTLAVEMVGCYGMAVGKAQPLTAKVLTPRGYKNMGDISTSDKVIGVDGRSHNILGIYPQGMKESYKITFSDGSSTFCCKDHLWALTTPKRKMRGNPNLVKTTSDLMNEKLYDEKHKSFKYSLPVNKPVTGFINKSKKLIHPYIIGVLIGDGSMQGTSVGFTHSEPFIPEKCNKLIHDYVVITKTKTSTSWFHRFKYKNGGRNNPYLTFIRDIGLNVRCEKKFIPKRYLYSSVEDRVNLLHGLMDTDGFVCKIGRLQFNTVAKKLKDDFRFLINSLGGNSRVSSKINSAGNESFTISFSLPEHISPCSFPRKLERVSKKKYHIIKSLKSIEDTNQSMEMQCIRTDAPWNLYITDDFIPTHNTTFETCVWIGRFIERFKREHKFIYRKDVKLNLCNSMRAKDANVRQALLDRFEPTGGGKTPQIGTKKQPGPLFGMSSHQWSALAVGITYMETREV